MIKDIVDNLPLVPGVYLMKDAHGDILYVGKSKCLKKRVQSYFYHNKSHPPKIRRLVGNVRGLDYRVTDTEFEALMLECRLIRELQPMYNKKLKTPAAYAFITVRDVRGIRRIEVTDQPAAQAGQRLIGPYTANHGTLERALQGIRETFRIDCARSARAGSACLNHALGRCQGACLGGRAAERHNEIIGRVAALLEGADRSLREEMERMMHEASASFDFEAAAKLRDDLTAVDYLLRNGTMIGFASDGRCNLVAEPMDDNGVKLFLVRRNQVLWSGYYDWNSSGTGLAAPTPVVAAAMSEAFRQGPPLAAGPVRREEIDEAQIIYSYLHSGHCAYLSIPDEWLRLETCEPLCQAVEELLGSVTGRIEEEV